jgi:hypothetical protein
VAGIGQTPTFQIDGVTAEGKKRDALTAVPYRYLIPMR